jgi:DNA-binding NarL/FixJ family response regulator
MIRVFLVDDHDVIRAGLKQILELDNDIRVAGEASRALDAIKRIETEQPDVVFMDIRMPGMNGIEAIRILRDKFPNIKLILLTNFKEEEYVVEGLKAGASGFLLKNITKEELHKAVHDVFDEKSVLTPDITPIVIREATRVRDRGADVELKGVHAKLTAREFEILDMMSRGLGNKEIGANLHLSEHTVKSHIKTIFRKLGAKTRSEAVYKAIKENLIFRISNP